MIRWFEISYEIDTWWGKGALRVTFRSEPAESDENQPIKPANAEGTIPGKMRRPERLKMNCWNSGVKLNLEVNLIPKVLVGVHSSAGCRSLTSSEFSSRASDENLIFAIHVQHPVVAWKSSYLYNFQTILRSLLSFCSSYPKLQNDVKFERFYLFPGHQNSSEPSRSTYSATNCVGSNSASPVCYFDSRENSIECTRRSQTALI